METPRSTSRSRRSYPNLHNLSLAPLSAKYPLDGSAPSSPDDNSSRQPRTSYIAQKSAPTTPGILSLSQSRSNSRHRAKNSYAYNGYFIDTSVREIGDVPKAKSTSTLLHHAVSFAEQVHEGLSGAQPRHARHPTRKPTAPLTRHHTSDANQEWLHRAGLAIASESRDSKGQGWLVRRASSTSLVSHHPSPDYADASHEPQRMALLSGASLADDEYPAFFSPPYTSRAGSRITSRGPSRAPSARQSRRGSRVDLRMATMAQQLDARLMKPDFIDDNGEKEEEEDDDDGESESDGDEEAVARLARERGAGLGGWVDRLIGWTLFSVEERGEAGSDGSSGSDGSGSDDDDDDGDDDDDYGGHGDEDDARMYGGVTPRLPNLTADALRLRREEQGRRRMEEREGIVAAAAAAVKAQSSGVGASGGLGERVDEGAEVETGGWQDAAWLLSVASKALLS